MGFTVSFCGCSVVGVVGAAGVLGVDGVAGAVGVVDVAAGCPQAAITKDSTIKPLTTNHRTVFLMPASFVLVSTSTIS